jgi:hypothetical protein
MNLPTVSILPSFALQCPHIIRRLEKEAGRQESSLTYIFQYLKEEKQK